MKKVRIAVKVIAACGTKLPIRDVRYPVADGGKPGMMRIPQFGREWTHFGLGGFDANVGDVLHGH
jgi:hypothetical protein